MSIVRLPAALDRARIDQLADLSVANGTFTTTLLASNTVRYNRGGMVSGGTFIARKPGVYAISGGLVFAGNVSGLQRIMRIVLNGSFVVGEETLFPIQNVAAGTFVSVSTELELVVGDVISFDAYQDSGGALNIAGTTSSSNPYTHGAIALVSR